MVEVSVMVGAQRSGHTRLWQSSPGRLSVSDGSDA
jgi:hypothetical protein